MSIQDISTQDTGIQHLAIQDIGTQVLPVQRSRSKTRTHRLTLVIVLLAILGFLGSLMLTVAATWVDNKTDTGSITGFRTLSHAKTLPTPPVTIRSSLKVPSTPSPITPFPPYLWQELAVLQSQNRFLFYGNSRLPEVALTFDDGPNPYYTSQVLAVLQHYRIKATFFCVGRQVAEYPDLVKQEYAAGNVIGNHSWSHPNMGLLSSSDISTQINLTSDTIQKTIGVRPTFFRPPYGVFNSSVLTQANLLGLTTVIWNDEARDWLRPGIDVISSRILGLAGNGAVVLLHDGGGDRSQTVAALPTIITTLQSQSYKFVTLQQMVNDLPKNPAANEASVSVPTLTPVLYPTPTVTPTSTPVISPTPTGSPMLTPTGTPRRYTSP